MTTEMSRREVVAGLLSMSIVPGFTAAHAQSVDSMIKMSSRSAPTLNAGDYTPTGAIGVTQGGGALRAHKRPFLIVTPSTPNSTAICGGAYRGLQSIDRILKRDCGPAASHVGFVALYPDIKTGNGSNLTTYINDPSYPVSGLTGDPAEVLYTLKNMNIVYTQDPFAQKPIIPNKNIFGRFSLSNVRGQELDLEQAEIGWHTDNIFLYGPPDRNGERPQIAVMKYNTNPYSIAAQVVSSMKEYGFLNRFSQGCAPQELLAQR